MQQADTTAQQPVTVLDGLRGGRVRLRLKHIILLSVLFTLVVAELAVLVPAMFIWHRDELQRLSSDALQLVKANVDATAFPTVAETVRVGQRIMPISQVRGGLIVNAIGDEVGVFGERPALGFSAVRRDNVLSRLTNDRQRLEVFFAPEQTGLAHGLIVRIDATGVPRAVLARLGDKASIILVVALVSGISVALLLGVFIVRPVLRLRDAAIAATDDPDNADRHKLQWQRSDELGDAARAFDLLLTAVSVVHQEDLAANQEAMQRSAHAILSYDPSGRLTAANPAAFLLFGVTTFDELARLPARYVRVKSVSGAVDMTPVELLGRNGDVAQLVTIVTPRQQRRCHLNATTIRKRNGTVLRHTVTLVDLTRQATYTEQLEAEIDQRQDVEAGLRRRIGEMRQLFQSCLVIMTAPAVEDAPPEDDPQDRPPVSTERVVNGWYADATRSGLVDGRLEHGALPDVRGDPDCIEGLFRQAMLAVYVRSSAETPVISVDAFPLSATEARFEIHEVDGPQTGVTRSDRHLGAAGAVIALRAVSIMVKAAGGTDFEAEGPGRGNLVAFTLPIVPGYEMAAYPASRRRARA